MSQIKALRDAGVTVTSSPAQMGSTLKKVMLQCLPVHCKSSLSGRIHVILSLVWGKLEPALILHRFRQPVLKGSMHNLLYFSNSNNIACYFSAEQAYKELIAQWNDYLPRELSSLFSDCCISTKHHEKNFMKHPFHDTISFKWQELEDHAILCKLA